MKSAERSGPFTINVHRSFRFLRYFTPSLVPTKSPHEKCNHNENARKVSRPQNTSAHTFMCMILRNHLALVWCAVSQVRSIVDEAAPAYPATDACGEGVPTYPIHICLWVRVSQRTLSTDACGRSRTRFVEIETIGPSCMRHPNQSEGANAGVKQRTYLQPDTWCKPL